MNTQDLDKLKKPYKIYTDFVEEGAMKQFLNVMELPTTVQGALMPDVHKGYTMPIGAVIACNDVVHPAFVGFDIGCGLTSFKLLNVFKSDIEPHKEEIFNLIKDVIPVGREKRKDYTQENITIDNLTDIGKEIATKRNWQNQLGTLGGGNHFIEVGYDEDSIINVTVHSGSRGTGHAIALHYMQLGSEGCLNEEEKELRDEFFKTRQDVFKHNLKAYNNSLEAYVRNGLRKYAKEKETDNLKSFTKGTKEYSDYMQDMEWCCEYARVNRQTMLQDVVGILGRVIEKRVIYNTINTNHNHAVESDEGVIHRKGAAPAHYGTFNVIPANMKDGVYLVKGKGCKDSLSSSSHGAGRTLGRLKAKKELDLDEFIDSMVDICSSADADRLDEAPLAYKDIVKVLNDQHELIEVVSHIKPLINIKG